MKGAVFHPGTQHSWLTALALQQLGRLQFYATTIFYRPERWPYRLERIAPGAVAERLHREFMRFHHPDLDPALVRTLGLAEWLERVAARAGRHELAARIDALGNHRFGRALGPALRSDEPFFLWGYNHSSLEAFRIGREQGRRCILDRTTPDLRAYNLAMDELARRYPDYFLPSERRADPAQIALGDAEFAAADTILVGSEYAAKTISDHAVDHATPGKVRLLPYSFDAARFSSVPAPRPVPRDRPLRFLFVGLTAPRKGIQHCFEAIARIPASAASLTVVGRLDLPRPVIERYADRVDFRGNVARGEVPGIMADHHVLLFPSYFEGGGIVLYEALAAGMALIQSDRAAIAVNPETGLLLDRLDSDTVHAAMMTAVEDRDRLDCWRAAAQSQAHEHTFARYRQRIAGLLKELGL